LNAVEIEEAISQLAGQPFDPQNFPCASLEGFSNKEAMPMVRRTSLISAAFQFCMLGNLPMTDVTFSLGTANTMMGSDKTGHLWTAHLNSLVLELSACEPLPSYLWF
jgi:hypothetical protein